MGTTNLDSLTLGTALVVPLATISQVNATQVTATTLAGTLFGGVQLPVAQRTTDGAITPKMGFVFLNKAGVLAATLADPITATDDGKVLCIIAMTANAHTVTNTTGFGAGGATLDVATFGGAIGDNMVIMAYLAKWYVISTRNVTLG
jgi:hypothetical protein